ncbi:hypothetical protein WJX84_007011 [Apatococcus fuscideae]|uniref:Uncharacterized protein n=1 Tax=Apatococcus fuscideae TaxID=2026836 RepID=A0AAW1SXR8_9CHLO
MDYSNALWRAGCSTFGPEPLTWSTLAINIAREERLVGGSPGRYEELPYVCTCLPEGVVPSLAYSRQQLPFGCALGGDLPARLVTIYIFAFLRQTWARLSPSLAR